MAQIALSLGDAVGRREHLLSLFSTKGDQSHLIPALVGVQQQREDRAFGRHHALFHSHRPTGIHHKEEQVAYLGLSHLLTQVSGDKEKTAHFLPSSSPSLLLMERGGSQRGIEGQILGSSLGETDSNIPSRSGVTTRWTPCSLRWPFLLSSEGCGQRAHGKNRSYRKDLFSPFRLLSL